MDNKIVSNDENLYAKYAEFELAASSADREKLGEDQKKIIDFALKKNFVNPKFKMKYFVTSGQTTPYSTLRQYFLELKNLEESCETIETKTKNWLLEIEILEQKIAIEKDEIKKKEFQIQYNQTQLDYKQYSRRLGQAYIEREQFIQLIQEFLDSSEGKTEDGRSLLEVFNTQEEDRYERQYWTVRLARQASMDITAFGKISQGNMDAIMQMPEEMQPQALALAHEFNMRVDGFSENIRNEVAKQLASDPEFSKLGVKPNLNKEITFSVAEDLDNVYNS